MDVTKSQNPDAIVLGSGKIEITRDKGATYTDLGLARGIKITKQGTNVEIKADNGTVPIRGKISRKAKVEFNLLERFLPNMHLYLDGMDALESVPGILETVTDVTPAAKVVPGEVRYFKKINADGSVPANIIVKQGTGGGTVTLVLDDDYRIVKANGAWGYFIIEGGAWDPLKDLKVTYDVVPPEAYLLHSGADGVLPDIGMRITIPRKSADGRTIKRIISLPFGHYDGEDSLTLKAKDDADQAAEVPSAFMFEPDPDLIETSPDKSLMSEEMEV